MNPNEINLTPHQPFYARPEAPTRKTGAANLRLDYLIGLVERLDEHNLAMDQKVVNALAALDTLRTDHQMMRDQLDLLCRSVATEADVLEDATRRGFLNKPVITEEVTGASSFDANGKAIVCPGCKHEIDPTTCWCGDEIVEGRAHDNHHPIPMGCTCGYSDAKPFVQPPPSGLEKNDCPNCDEPAGRCNCGSAIPPSVKRSE
jgi:hypothetical protein